MHRRADFSEFDRAQQSREEIRLLFEDFMVAFAEERDRNRREWLHNLEWLDEAHSRRMQSIINAHLQHGRTSPMKLVETRPFGYNRGIDNRVAGGQEQEKMLLQLREENRSLHEHISQLQAVVLDLQHLQHQKLYGSGTPESYGDTEDPEFAEPEQRVKEEQLRKVASPYQKLKDGVVYRAKDGGEYHDGLVYENNKKVPEDKGYRGMQSPRPASRAIKTPLNKSITIERVEPTLTSASPVAEPMILVPAVKLLKRSMVQSPKPQVSVLHGNGGRGKAPELVHEFEDVETTDDEMVADSSAVTFCITPRPSSEAKRDFDFANADDISVFEEEKYNEEDYSNVNVSQKPLQTSSSNKLVFQRQLRDPKDPDSGYNIVLVYE